MLMVKWGLRARVAVAVFLSLLFRAASVLLVILWKYTQPHIHPALRGTKRGVILVLCLLISGILTLYRHEAKAATDPSISQYQISIGPVSGSGSTTYNYATLLNPSGSGKAFVLKRIRIKTDATTTAVYQDLSLYRITTASAGTQITAANIPKKNPGSTNSAADIRYAGVTTSTITANNRLMGVIASGAAGMTNNDKDYTFTGQQLILQAGEGISLSQTAAGSANQRIRMVVEWEEDASAPAATNEYMLAYPAVSNAGGTNYFYQTLFNPSASATYMTVQRLNIDVDCSAAAVYTDNIQIKRITAASAGTQITQANIPKKHTGAGNSIAEARYGGTTAITATLDATTTGVIDQVTPCGTTSQGIGHSETTYGDSYTESIVLAPGQGIALVGSATGSASQLVRLSAVWGEQASNPASQGQYTYSAGPVAGSATSGAGYVTFWNPSASGKTAVVNRISLAADATTTSATAPLTVQRISAYTSGGTAVTASTISKNNSSSATSAMALYTGSPTVTKLGTAAARIMTVDTPAAVGQTFGHLSRYFAGDQPIVLQPGQGIIVYQEAAGSTGFNVKVGFEWGEQASAPATTGEYMWNTGSVTGSTTSNYIYSMVFNPSGSGKNIVFHHISINAEASTTAVYIPMSVVRISAYSTGGTSIAASDIPVKHTGTAASAMTVRTANPTVTRVGTTSARLYSVTTPGGASSATAPQTSGNDEYDFTNTEQLVLKPGEGIIVSQEGTGSASYKVRVGMEWEERATAPVAQNEYTMAIGQVAGTTTSGYVYASLLNPSSSGKKYVIKQLEVEATRTVAGTTTPAISIRPTTAASAGTTVAATDVPKKNSASPTSGADVRVSGPTVTWSGVADSRLIGVTNPNAVGIDSGTSQLNIIYGQELVLNPGQGIAMYQEAAGDTGVKYTMRVVWSEISSSYNQASYRLFNNQDTANTTNFTTSTYPIGTTPGGMTTADYNGDGKPDFATANWGAKTISVYMNNGSGGFTGSTISGLTSGPLDITSADFNGDGKPDLATANGSGNNVYIYLNNGSGSFSLSSTVATGTNDQYIVSADFTGDGKPDLAVSNYSSNTVSILKNGGTGTFTLAASPAVGSFPDGLTAADFTGDGSIDIAVANNGSNTLSILTNSGTGTFTLAASPAVGSGPTNITSRDLNGDGIADLAISNTVSGSAATSILLNNGTGTFSVSSNLGGNNGGMTTADFNSDGAYDLAVSAAGSGTGNVVVFLNDGSGNFTTSSTTAVGNAPGTIVNADFNGDGKPDMAEVNGSDATVSVLLWANPVDVGTALAAQNTAATSPGDGQAFRLRMDIGVSTDILSSSGQSFNLQYAPMTTSCDTSFTNTPASAYANVTDTSPVRYYNNPHASNASPLTSNANDPLDGSNPLVRETYQEAGTTTFTNPNSISTGNDGMWDFALTTNGTSGGQHYCFRVVTSSGTALNAYTTIPEIIIPASGLNQASYRLFNNQDVASSGGTFATAWGSTNADYGESVVKTSDGGYAVGGYTNGYGAGNNDAFIAKYDSTGTLSWSRTWGGTGADFGYALVQTSDGGYAISGQTYSFGDTTNGDMFLAKFDSTGTLSWSRTWGGTGADVGQSLVQTSDGGYAVTGQTKSYGDTSKGDMFLAKYDSTGALSWSRTWGGTGTDWGQSLVQTSDGGYAVTGYTGSYGDTTFYDVFLAKYDSTGALSWSRTWGSTAGFDEGYSIIQTSDGGYAITGMTASFGAGSDDVFIIKYDSTGTLSWSRTWGGTGTDDAYSLTQTSDGGYALTGYTTSFGAGSYDIFLIKYDSTGTLSWSRTWGSTFDDRGQSISKTTDGGYVVTGNTNGYGAGNYDMIIAKFDSTGAMSGCSSTMCQTPTPTTSSPTPTTTSPSATTTSPTATTTSPTATATSPSATSTVILGGPPPIDVGTPLAAQNTAATTSGDSQPFRMRLDIGVSNSTLATSGQSLKLQYALRTTSCDTSFTNTPSASYADVSNTSTVRYYDNTVATNAAAFATNANDPTDGSNTLVRQTYQEYGTTTFTNPNAVPAAQDGMWDFALTTNGTSGGQHFCLRLVTSTGGTLSTYTVLPEIITPVTNTAPNSPTSLVQAKTDNTTLATGAWVNATSVKFTASATDPDASDTEQLCVEAQPLATTFTNTETLCGTGVAYSGTAVSVTVTLTGLSDATQYHWQARVKDAGGLYSTWVSYGGNAESAIDFGTDTTPPTGGTVYDGTTVGTDASFNDGSLSALSANWSGVSANASGLAGYEYSIGTSAGATDVKGWTSNGTATTVTASGLTLHTSNKYFINVRTTDNAGNTAVISSDGQFVAPSVSFGVSPSTITFNKLNASNSYTDTKTTTLTTSTNAYGGYVVRDLLTDFPRSAGNKTIPDFTGGTYASPDSWQTGDIGLGYTSSDTSVQGVNKFQSATCPGGSAIAAPGCYAPFSHTNPGDIVADNTNAVSGSPITNEQFTITYRITTLSTQAATTYNTAVIYSITPVY